MIENSGARLMLAYAPLLERLEGLDGQHYAARGSRSPPSGQLCASGRAASGQYLLITLPNQPLDDIALARFTSRLGPFGLEPFVEGESTHPNVIAVVKEADETKRLNFGGNWHTGDG